MPTVKISILKSIPSDSGEWNYDDRFMPVHQSDWIEVDEAELPKIKKGLEIMGRNAPLRGSKYYLFVKPIDERSIIQESLKLFEDDVVQQQEAKRKKELDKLKSDENKRLNKAINELRAMIKAIEHGTLQDEALKASSVASLQAQIDELQREKKGLNC